MSEHKCNWCGSKHCYTKTYHREMPTTTFLPSGITLEHIIGVLVEELHTMPYCKRGQEMYQEFHPHECHDHHHTPNVIDVVVKTLQEKIQPKCISIPTVEEIHSESCNKRALEIQEARDEVTKPFWIAIDRALVESGYKLNEVYRDVAIEMSKKYKWPDVWPDGEFEYQLINKIKKN